jgi:uridine phosphorylase
MQILKVEYFCIENTCFFKLFKLLLYQIAAVVCVSLVDRLNGDQVSLSHDLNVEYQERPFKLVGKYIKNNL